MTDKRWVSRALVHMLVGMKDYDSAAEVVSGSLDVFSVCSRRIQETLAAGSAFSELQQALDEAREEINDHRKWETAALDRLPQVDLESGLTTPLCRAFSDTAKARVQLLIEVMEAGDKYLECQTKAFSLST